MNESQRKMDSPNTYQSKSIWNEQKHPRAEESFTSEPESRSPVSNKRPKTLTLISNSSPKGKEKIEEEEEMETETCGICLRDDGKSIRGKIDSCDHFFCFVCIMEWSKLESRCPMCKQRFNSIRRPPKSGVFVSERVVTVPVRDQVYHPLGNGTGGPSDPYANVCCNECQGSENESLLLLCDLCDSAAHTYCVGLGATVPEGDWYCHECTVLRNEQSNAELDSDCGNLNYQIQGNQVEPDRIPRRAHSRSSSLPPEQSSSTATSIVRPEKSSSTAISIREPEQSARTLNQCRNLHGRIQALRENWNALRNGSVSFSSNLLASGNIKNVRRHISKAVNRHKFNGSKSLVSTDCCSLAMERNELSCNKSSDDISRAWKMMDIAKSMSTQPDHCQTADCPASERNVSKGASNRNTSFSMLNGKISVHEVSSGVVSEKCNKLNSLKLVHKPHGSQKQKPMTDMKAIRQNNIRSPASHQSGHCELPSSKQVAVSFQKGVSQPALQGESDSDNELDPSCSRKQPVLSSGSKMNLSRMKVEGDRKSDAMKRKDDSAKSEVQSLVKLNLKLLSKDRQLGVDRFKVVARLATHTILAACGLEHSKSSVRPFLSLTCSHVMQLKALRTSSLMPSSCRECFYGFVKDVVHSIMTEKTPVTTA